MTTRQIIKISLVIKVWGVVAYTLVINNSPNFPIDNLLKLGKSGIVQFKIPIKPPGILPTANITLIMYVRN